MNEQVICPKCQGDGKVWADGRTHYPFSHFPTKDCPKCNGTGNVPAQPQQPVPTEGLLKERARDEMMQADIARIMADRDGLDEVPDDIWADYQGYAAMILAKVSASFSAQLAEALKAQKAHILAEVDKARLTDEQLRIAGGWEATDFLAIDDYERDIAAAQLEAIKKQLRG